MLNEDVVCGGVKCPECCGPSCPVSSSLGKVKSQTSRRVALGTPRRGAVMGTAALCSGSRTWPFIALCLGCPGLPQIGRSQGMGAAETFPQGAIRWGAGTRHTDEFQTQSGTEAQEGLGCPPGDRPEAQTSELSIKEWRGQLIDHRPVGTQAGGILKPPHTPLPLLRKPFETGQEDILENNCLSLSFAVSSECEFERLMKVFVISKSSEFTVVPRTWKRLWNGQKRLLDALHYVCHSFFNSENFHVSIANFRKATTRTFLVYSSRREVGRGSESRPRGTGKGRRCQQFPFAKNQGELNTSWRR